MEQLCSEESGERLVAELIEDTVGSAGGSATVLAYQWRKAGDSERAVDYLLMAAEQAGGGSLGAEAVALYNQALELMPEGESDRRREVNLKRAVAYARYTHAIKRVSRSARTAKRWGVNQPPKSAGVTSAAISYMRVTVCPPTFSACSRSSSSFGAS